MTDAVPMHDEILALKQRRILDAALDHFYRNGFTGATLDDIAGSLGVTKPFIYSYFPTKTSLLDALCLPTIEMCLAAAAGVDRTSGSPALRLRQLVEAFARIVLDRQRNIAVFFREEKSLSASVAKRISRLRKEFAGILAALIREGIAAGEFDVDDAEIAAMAISGMVSWTFTWYHPGQPPSPEQLCAGMAELALRMAGIRRGAPPDP